MKLNTSIRKRFRVRKKVKKVAPSDRFRLCISRSSKNISAQISDDNKNITLLSTSSVEKDIKTGSKVNKTELSKVVAEKLAKKAKEKKITKIFFDDLEIHSLNLSLDATFLTLLLTLNLFLILVLIFIIFSFLLF